MNASYFAAMERCVFAINETGEDHQVVEAVPGVWVVKAVHRGYWQGQSTLARKQEKQQLLHQLHREDEDLEGWAAKLSDPMSRQDLALGQQLNADTLGKRVTLERTFGSRKEALEFARAHCGSVQGCTVRWKTYNGN